MLRPCLLFLLATLLPAAAPAAPQLTRSLDPPLLAFYVPPPLPARPPARWRLALAFDYASVFQVEGPDEAGTVVDLELARLALHAGRRLGPRLALDLELPWIATTGGFLDDFVNGWHRTFHLPDGGRPQAPSNRHLYRVRVGGRTLLEERAGSAGLGDAAATLTWLARDRPAGRLALRLGVKAPTAGPRFGPRGSGGWDLAAGAVVEATRGPWSAALHLAAVVPTGVPELATRPYAAGLLHLAWRATRRLALTGGLAAQSSPLETGVARLDRPAVALRAGLAYNTRGSATWEAAFVEDLTHETTPDFSLHLALRLER